MILEKLRSETKEQHELLDSIPLLKPLGEGNLTKEQYIRVLEAFYGFFSGVEEQIESFEEMKIYLDDLHERRKSSWIISDITTLGQNYTAVSVCKDLPLIGKLSNAFGALYVLEGSTLGGTLIAKRVNDQLCYSQDSGASFFCGYGKQTRAKWDGFKNALILFTEKNPGSESEIIQTAKDTFYKFSIWLGKNR